jgi:DNA-binding transcriptional MerR regulator/GGDEF domain-containing protein
MGITYTLSQESDKLMDDKDLQNIKQHLQGRDAQNRILKNIERARSETTVTIGRAASLFDFTENQLRDWEVKNRLTPNKSAGGQRLYPLSELDKLAIIRELLDAKFSPGGIPENIDTIWKAISPVERHEASSPASERGHLLIDQRVDENDHNVFWQYFVSQVLRISLLLICEDMPDTIAGLVLPLQQTERIYSNDPKDLQRLGLSLVGWLTRNRTFHAFLDTAPSFEFPSDFRIEHLRVPGANIYPFTPYIVIQRRARYLTISPVLAETIYRLLQLVYNHVDNWQPSFQAGMGDYVYQVTDFSRGSDVTDFVLDGIVNMVIELGGKMPDGTNRWHFCNLFLPQDDSLPVQQQKLSVRAHSKDSPARIISMTASTAEPGLTFRAYQSGHVIHRSSISTRDHILAYQDTEMETRSAMAIPVGSEFGMAVAALYIASSQENAFNDADLPALRVIVRMIEELLPTYRARQQVPGKLSDLLNYPRVVDLAFREFLSEDDFLDDLETLLSNVLLRNDIVPEKRPDATRITNDVVSFVEVDIDNQATLAMKYGNQVARNLSKEVGLRIQGHLRLLSNSDYRRLYHVNADTYYMIFEGMSLNEARDLAETLRKLLSGVYRIDARRVVLGRPLSLVQMLELPNVTVRLGVQNYYFSKLKYDLLESPVDSAMPEKRHLIIEGSDESLKRGQAAGGDCIFSWDYEKWDHIYWQADE